MVLASCMLATRSRAPRIARCQRAPWCAAVWLDCRRRYHTKLLPASRGSGGWQATMLHVAWVFRWPSCDAVPVGRNAGCCGSPRSDLNPVREPSTAGRQGGRRCARRCGDGATLMHAQERCGAMSAHLLPCMPQGPLDAVPLRLGTDTITRSPLDNQHCVDASQSALTRHVPGHIRRVDKI